MLKGCLKYNVDMQCMQYILDATFEMQCLQCNAYDSIILLYLLYNVDSSLVMDSFRNDNGSNICL